MAEPSCDRLFDFDFERRATGDHEMSEAEVRRLMFAEVCNYRPCAEGKSGNISRWGTNLGGGAKGGPGAADSKAHGGGDGE